MLDTDHSDGEVVVDDVVGDVLHALVDGLRLVPLLVMNTDLPPVQQGSAGLGNTLRSFLVRK